MERSCRTLVILFVALIEAFQASDAVEVIPSINPAVVGGTVTLSLSPPMTLKTGNWAVGESLILTWLEGQQAVFPSHSGRASVNITTGALTLTSLTLADSGVYVVQSGDPVLRANASVTVVESISNVTLSVNQTDLIELRGSAQMTCSVSSGSSLSVVWMNGSSKVSAKDRVQLTEGNSTVTVVNVTRYDSGPFSCYVSNPVSNGTSDPVNFAISYGPDNMVLTVNGLNGAPFLVGSNLTLNCSAESSPPAALQWAFRGHLVNRSGPVLELVHVTAEQSGPYSCLAFNNRTNVQNNRTTNILISKSEQQVVSSFLLILLSLTGFFLPLPG